MQSVNELCGQIKTLMHERALSELTLYACDFCGSNTEINEYEEFIAAFRDTLPWNEMDINDFTWDDSCDLYGILGKHNYHTGYVTHFIRQIRSENSGFVFKVESRCYYWYEEYEAHGSAEEFSLEQLIKEFGEEKVTAHLEKIYNTLTSAEWLFELNNMKKS